MHGEQGYDERDTPHWTRAERWAVVAILAQAVVPVGRLLWGRSAVIHPLVDTGFATFCVVGAAWFAWSAERRVRRVIASGTTDPTAPS